MSVCEHLIWILASVLALCIVAYHHRRPQRRRRLRCPSEAEYYAGDYTAPCPPRGNNKAHHMPPGALQER